MTDEIKKLVRNFLKEDLAKQIVELQKTITEMEKVFNQTEEENVSLRSRLKTIQDSKLIILTDGKSSGTQVIWEGEPIRDLNTVKLFVSHKAVNASVQKMIPSSDGSINRPIVNLIGEGYKPAAKKQHKQVIKEPLTKTISPKAKETHRKKSPAKIIKKANPEPATKKEVLTTFNQPDAWTCFECGAVNDKSKKKKGKVQCYSCKTWTKEDEL
ncbi:hypothetical protein [Terribacillus sp. JSM ZJ617]|uniref:hypothetical protein n=1 Tax=Terribacillus sp. JSM ZJ617 TaxID=3342119 RepID=UPI0035A8D17A